MKYRANALEQYAEQLEDRADRIVAIRAIIGAITGGVALWVAGLFLPVASGQLAIPGALVGGLFGYGSAQSQALVLRVQAVTLLALAKIEENTRKDPAK